MSETTSTTDTDIQAQLDTMAVEIADLKARVSHLEVEGGLSSTTTTTTTTDDVQ